MHAPRRPRLFRRGLRHRLSTAPICCVQAETGATMRVTKSMQVLQTAARFRRYAQGAMESTTITLDPAVMPSTALAPGGIVSAIGNRAPVGAVTCISSYNFPMVNMAGKIAPALAMGNTVIMKPAPQDPLGVIDGRWAANR